MRIEQVEQDHRIFAARPKEDWVRVLMNHAIAELEGRLLFVLPSHLVSDNSNCVLYHSFMYHLGGLVIGRWKVTNRFESRRRDRPGQKHCIRFWLCQCECGNEKWVSAASLMNGHSQSCGCIVKEIVGARFLNPSPELRTRMRELVITHGMSRTKVYKAWQSMKQRCDNPKCPEYKHYGGRGITVCEE